MVISMASSTGTNGTRAARGSGVGSFRSFRFHKERCTLVHLLLVCGTRSSMLAGLSCTKGVWYIYDWDTGSTILIW